MILLIRLRLNTNASINGKITTELYDNFLVFCKLDWVNLCRLISINTDLTRSSRVQLCGLQLFEINLSAHLLLFDFRRWPQKFIFLWQLHRLQLDM